MSGNTPNFFYPYPTAGDLLCDGNEELQSLAQAVQGRIDIENLDIPRLDKKPFVRFATRGTQTLTLTNGSALIPFNEISIDTAGMGDLSRSPYGAFPTRPGQYEIGFYAHFGPSNVNATDGQMQVIIQSTQGPTAGTESEIRWDGGVGNTDNYLYLVLSTTYLPPAITGPPAFTVTFFKSATAYTGSHATDQVLYFSTCYMMFVGEIV